MYCTAGITDNDVVVMPAENHVHRTLFQLKTRQLLTGIESPDTNRPVAAGRYKGVDRRAWQQAADAAAVTNKGSELLA